MRTKPFRFLVRLYFKSAYFNSEWKKTHKILKILYYQKFSFERNDLFIKNKNKNGNRKRLLGYFRPSDIVIIVFERNIAVIGRNRDVIDCFP